MMMHGIEFKWKRVRRGREIVLVRSRGVTAKAGDYFCSEITQTTGMRLRVGNRFNESRHLTPSGMAVDGFTQPMPPSPAPPCT